MLLALDFCYNKSLNSGAFYLYLYVGRPKQPILFICICDEHFQSLKLGKKKKEKKIEKHLFLQDRSEWLVLKLKTFSFAQRIGLLLKWEHKDWDVFLTRILHDAHRNSKSQIKSSQSGTGS